MVGDPTLFFTNHLLSLFSTKTDEMEKFHLLSLFSTKTDEMEKFSLKEVTFFLKFSSDVLSNSRMQDGWNSSSCEDACWGLV